MFQVEILLQCKLTCVPMQEGLPTKHGRELLSNPLKELLDRCGIADKRGRHFESPRRYIAHRRLHIVGDPLDKVGGVLVLDVEQLFVHLLHGHAAAKDAGDGQVAAVGGIAGRHHVFSVEHLLCQLRHSQRSRQMAPQSTYVCRVQSSVWRLPKY
jgi:hypothetical protein